MRSGLFGNRSVGRRGEFWALVGNKRGRFAQPFARNNCAREWAEYGIGRLVTSALSSIGGSEKGIGATGGGGVVELDEAGRNVTVSGPPLPAACQ